MLPTTIVLSMRGVSTIFEKKQHINCMNHDTDLVFPGTNGTYCMQQIQ